jgi:hypothetical protein
MSHRGHNITSCDTSLTALQRSKAAHAKHILSVWSFNFNLTSRLQKFPPPLLRLSATSGVVAEVGWVALC